MRTAPDHSLASQAEQAYQMLRKQLLTLRLAPGELLVERDLVSRAGIGRTPVREAIQRLSAEGLLQVLPRKGLMVTPLRRSDLKNIIETRRVLERLMVVKAAERATADQRRTIQSLAEEIEGSDHGAEVLFLLVGQLDKQLEAACRNPFLVNALAATRGQLGRFWYMQRDRLDLSASAQLYGGMARAVADGDGAGAIRALDETIATLHSLISEFDELS